MAVTAGIMDLLTWDELKGVLAHELAHVGNRDILITSIAAAVATGISYLANMLMWLRFSGSTSDDEDAGPGPLGLLVTALLAPIAATILQLALSRSREYEADAAGARLLGDGRPLASALAKLDRAARMVPMDVDPAHQVHRQPADRPAHQLRQPVLHPPAHPGPNRPARDRRVEAVIGIVLYPEPRFAVPRPPTVRAQTRTDVYRSGGWGLSVVVGGGKPALPRDAYVELELLDERRLTSGVVYLRHRKRPEHDAPGSAAPISRQRDMPGDRLPLDADFADTLAPLVAAPAGHSSRVPDHDHRRKNLSHVRRFDHVGITVADLDAATDFFVALGLEIEGRTFVEGEFIDTVIGILGARTEIVMLRPPDMGTGVELSGFVRPSAVPGSPTAMVNESGLRSIAFEVHDLDAAVDQAASAGYGLVGGVGEYEGSWRMAYVRGPEGIIVALAQPIA